jgi:hypothetical protein
MGEDEPVQVLVSLCSPAMARDALTDSSDDGTVVDQTELLRRLLVAYIALERDGERPISGRRGLARVDDDGAVRRRVHLGHIDVTVQDCWR